MRPTRRPGTIGSPSVTCGAYPGGGHSETFHAAAQRRGLHAEERGGASRAFDDPAGVLDDAAEVARAGVPTVMMFVQSLHGISHNKIEDTKEEHLELCVTAFDKLAEKAMQHIVRALKR